MLCAPAHEISVAIPILWLGKLRQRWAGSAGYTSSSTLTCLLSSAVLGTSGHVCGKGGERQGSGMMSDPHPGIWFAMARTHVDLRFIYALDSREALFPDCGPPDSVYTFHFSVGVTLQMSIQSRWAVSCPMGSSCPAAIGPVLWPHWPPVLVPSFHDSQNIPGTREAM